MVTIIGGGLSGSEAAWQIARRGIKVRLFEMRPETSTTAHQTGCLAELVCSNSLRAAALTNAVGLLKEEMRYLDSLIISCADAHSVPAGGALAVDREAFAAAVTTRLEQHPLVEICRQEVCQLPPERPIIVATGPLTAGYLAESLQTILGEEFLFFFDAAAPIVTAESWNYNIVFKASRYDKGEAAYLNCPMDKGQYQVFFEELLSAEVAEVHSFEKEQVFEGCMPVEVMAARGEETLRFGPLKPVGLVDPRTGKQPYAVVQLRQDNLEGTLYNMVGFQTHLKWGEQSRVFRLVPGMEKAEFVRFGVMHRNTYICSPKLLLPTLQLRTRPDVFFAGQITGVEGYVESAANGLVAGINAALLTAGRDCKIFPKETAIGALCHYLHSGPEANFQPMNINFGLLPMLEKKIKPKTLKNQELSKRALSSLKEFRKKTAIYYNSSLPGYCEYANMIESKNFDGK